MHGECSLKTRRPWLRKLPCFAPGGVIRGPGSRGQRCCRASDGVCSRADDWDGAAAGAERRARGARAAVTRPVARSRRYKGGGGREGSGAWDSRCWLTGRSLLAARARHAPLVFRVPALLRPPTRIYIPSTPHRSTHRSIDGGRSGWGLVCWRCLRLTLCVHTGQNGSSRRSA